MNDKISGEKNKAGNVRFIQRNAECSKNAIFSHKNSSCYHEKLTIFLKNLMML